MRDLFLYEPTKKWNPKQNDKLLSYLTKLAHKTDKNDTKKLMKKFSERIAYITLLSEDLDTRKNARELLKTLGIQTMETPNDLLSNILPQIKKNLKSDNRSEIRSAIKILSLIVKCEKGKEQLFITLKKLEKSISRALVKLKKVDAQRAIRKLKNNIYTGFEQSKVDVMRDNKYFTRVELSKLEEIKTNYKGKNYNVYAGMTLSKMLYDLPEGDQKTFLTECRRTFESLGAKLYKDELLAVETLEKEQELYELIQSSKSEAAIKFKGIPRQKIWRLFIDGFRHPEEGFQFMDRYSQKFLPEHYDDSQAEEHVGKFQFDRKEPGFMRGMFQSMIYMITNINKALTPDMLEHINLKAKKGVKFEGEDFLKKSIGIMDMGYASSSLRDPSDEFSNTTNKGINEFKMYLKKNNSDWIGLRDDASGKSYKQFFSKPKSRKERIKRIEELTAEYQAKIKNASNDDDKLNIIVDYIQQMNRHHFFEDGNIRTLGMILFYRLLSENRIDLTILSNPNMFEGVDCTSLVDAVKEGQKTFKTYCS
ncbi:MAG: hypothetical protein HRT90_10950 [Candidatus Margulisbacteria bacterium]|nr:hypothetical protein [Candidatus Margulisiibacteriota bacterium]